MLRDYITLMEEKPDDFTGSDEDWETYYIYNSVMKSLRAMHHMCKDKCGDLYTICKAEATISALLEETGRRDRFMKWQRHDEEKDMEDAFERSIAEGIKKHNCHHCGAKMNNQEKGKNNMDLLNDTKGMRHQATELIEQAYHKGYKAGVEDGKNHLNNNVIFTSGTDAVVITTLCKDCKFRTDTGICEKLRLNEVDGNFILKVHKTHDMDYCSLGKRKE